MNEHAKVFIDITEKIAQTIAKEKRDALSLSLKNHSTSFKLAKIFNAETKTLLNGHALGNILNQPIDFFNDDSFSLTTIAHLDDSLFNTLSKVMTNLNINQLIKNQVFNYTYKSLKKKVANYIIMPVKTTILIGGFSTIVIFPITFLIHKNLDHIVKPIFKKGQYDAYVNKVHFYNDSEQFLHNLVKLCRLHYDNLEKNYNDIYIETTKIDLTKKKTKDLLKDLNI